MKTSDFDEQGGDLPHLEYFVQQEKEEVMLKKKERYLFRIYSFLTFATSQAHHQNSNIIRELRECLCNKECTSAEINRWREISVNTAPAECGAAWAV